MVYKIRSRVTDLQHKTRAVSGRKHPTIENEVIIEREDIGWFVTFENSHESLFMGMEEPKDLQPDTEVDIIIRPRR
jgi:hypothetical protein